MAVAVAVAAALAGCSHEDKTFGPSFDACVLQNATRGGDDDSRSKAEEICGRHFNRAPTELEASLASGSAKIVTLKPAPAPPAADNTTGPWTEYSNAFQEGDTIHASVDNKTSDDVIKKVHIAADFYDGPANADGQFVGRKHLGSLYWDLNADIEPGASDDIYGTFDGNKAPSYFYSAHFTPTQVLPHTGVPQKSPLNETDR